MRLKTLIAPAALALASAGLLLSSTPSPDRPSAGDAAPEIDGARWFNHLGAAPTLASLRGRAVLIEFWATW